MKKIVRPKNLGLKDSLKAMEIGSTRQISTSEYKANVLRTTVYNLNKDAYKFCITEKGLIDSMVVTRLK